MPKTILITGASGLIGKALTRALIGKGYAINMLTHSTAIQTSESALIKIFKWNIDKQEIDPDCIKQVDAIIHLAGESVASGRWDAKRKVRLAKSRIESIKLIYSLLEKDSGHQIKTIISASAIGYYGHRGDESLSEDSPPGTDFLSRLCVDWENTVGDGRALGLRTVCLRTGLVLSKEGGGLGPIVSTTRLGLATVLGPGTQWVSWIHIEDVVSMYIHALENTSIHGVYNMVAPYPVSNQELVKTLAQTLKKPLWLIHIPTCLLHLLLGEMSILLLNSTKVSSDKIISKGFNFKFSNLTAALKNLY
jgi:uncharacterized protein (TIGR01777 family)